MEIFPEIEAARPCCSSGIEALCLLNNAIIKAKLLICHCAESSKLYLALTGEAILSRCNKSRNLLELSLSQMQNMVPPLLEAKISQVVSDLRNASFSLDPLEEDAGKVLLDLLRKNGSAKIPLEGSTLQVIQYAIMRLNISSKKALLIEKRSIKKQLYDTGENHSQKRTILVFFQILLKKYGNLIVKEDDSFKHHVEEEVYQLGEPNQFQVAMSVVPSAPEEFKCPLSSELMCDPVVIASGQTFERKWIQKWFDEGHDTCPRTKVVLSHLTLTPNTCMKDLIVKWCGANNVVIPERCLLDKCQSLDTSSSSISSLSSSMSNLSLSFDISNMSIGSSVGSSDSRLNSDSSCSKFRTNADMKSIESCARFNNGTNIPESDMQLLFEFDSLPWELICKYVIDIENSLNSGHHSCSLTSCKTLTMNISKFLKDSHDYLDTEAQKNGCLLLLALLRNCRISLSCLGEETYCLLASLLDSDVAENNLAIFEELSCHDINVHGIAASGMLNHILRILTGENTRLQEPALKFLHKFSANRSSRSYIQLSDLIPILLPLLDNCSLSSLSIAIIENLIYSQDARDILAETDECISSIAKLLESNCYDNQEHAVSILLSLCCQRVRYCELVMDEGVIPALVAISNNGTNRGKAMATELLRLLRDEVGNNDKSHVPKSEGFRLSDLQDSKDKGNLSMQRKLSSKATGVFRKMSIFSKHSSLSTRTS